MKINMTEYDHQPETFNAGEGFCVFVDESIENSDGTHPIIGCGNIYWEPV